MRTIIIPYDSWNIYVKDQPPQKAEALEYFYIS